MRRIVFALVLFAAPFAHAALDRAQLAQIHRAVDELLRLQTSGLPGRVSYSIGVIDERLALPPCTAPEAFVPPGVRLWGNANVGVRCTVNTMWTIYVPVTIRVAASVVIAARTLPQGRAIEPGDVTVQEFDLGQLPGAVVTDTRMAIGRLPTHGIAAGQPLRQDLLRSPPVIQQGQSVTLRSQGPGFRVTAEAKAITTASDGQIAQVRTPSGQTLSGVARAGGIVDLQVNQ